MIRVDYLRESGIDVDGLLERFAGNVVFIEKIVVKYLNDSTFDKFSKSFELVDLEDMEKNVHTLKGLSLNLGFTRLSNLCMTFLSDIRENYLDRLSGVFEEIKLEHLRLLTVLNSNL